MYFLSGKPRYFYSGVDNQYREQYGPADPDQIDDTTDNPSF